MRPIRTEHKAEVIRDPWTGQILNHAETDTIHALDDNDTLRSFSVMSRVPNSCGCIAPPGGLCSVCSSPVCAACFAASRCVLCRRPSCPAHAVHQIDASGRTFALCGSCHGAVQRRRRLYALAHALLSPFVQWERSHGTR
ncbi:MAG: hypothetical protein IT434_11750 [Phycisphaerales bacterium]|jgi:hypothetical protein|nr:hypothetical protein [Phycisphaerales bacterium]